MHVITQRRIRANPRIRTDPALCANRGSIDDTMAVNDNIITDGWVAYGDSKESFKHEAVVLLDMPQTA